MTHLPTLMQASYCYILLGRCSTTVYPTCQMGSLSLTFGNTSLNIRTEKELDTKHIKSNSFVTHKCFLQVGIWSMEKAVDCFPCFI